MKELLNILFEYKTLSKEQAKDILMRIAKEEFNSSQVASFMSVFLMRPITVEELTGFREAMLEICLPVIFETSETIDIVGTGGDGKDTFNISTLACFVAAGAGIKVTKHGNYGVSSVSGSSNVLEAIGYSFTNDQTVLQKQLDKAGLCFMHAPLFHPAMKSIAPIRKELGVRTFFNMLGPVVNPCKPNYQLLGVYNLEMARLYNYMLQDSDVEYMIVHSFDGYDEISLTGDFKLISKNREEILNPSDLNFSKIDPIALSGGSTVNAAAKLFLDILDGKGTSAQNNVVIANAAVAIRCVKPGRTKEECIQMAVTSLSEGKAKDAYKKLIAN